MRRVVLAVPFLAGLLSAQSVFHGNGFPSAYVENTPGVLGQQLTVGYGSSTTPLPLALFGLSDGIGPVFIPHPLLGNIGLDLFSPAYQAFTFGLDVAGNGSATLLLPPGWPLPTDPPLFAHAATFEATALSISKTVRIEWANPNGWEAVAPLAAARQMHTATALGTSPRDNVTEVLICGGATGSFILPSPLDSAELYAPLTRTTSPLPNLSLPRAGHRAVRLLDGRVLITGGVTTGGVVTATCEIFDPVTLTFAPAAAMSAPRASHAVTLLDDGRLLASGGVADWQNAGAQFIQALNTAQNTAEVYDPALDAWLPLPNMAARRLGHSQTKLLDGRVLVISGITGGYAGAYGSLGGVLQGQIPLYTTTCELFDPVSGTFAATAALVHLHTPPFSSVQTYNGRAFHGASLLPSGNVLLTGGFAAQPFNTQTQDASIALALCDVWSVTAGTWSVAAPLPAAAAMHGQLPFRTGAIVSGGFTNPLSTLATTAGTVFHDGAAVSVLADIGVDGLSGSPLGRGAHTLTALYDGTFLVFGGGAWPNTLADGWVYTPN